MAAKKKPNKTAEDGRKGNGQFAAGNNFGGAAPYSKNEREHKKLIDEAIRGVVTPERAAKIIEVLTGKAEEGNIEAAKFLFDRVLGRPVTRIAGVEDEPPVDVIVYVKPPDSKRS